jgi:hypothetical protein
MGTGLPAYEGSSSHALSWSARRRGGRRGGRRRRNDQPEVHSQYTERNRARSRLKGRPGSTRNPNVPPAGRRTVRLLATQGTAGIRVLVRAHARELTSRPAEVSTPRRRGIRRGRRLPAIRLRTHLRWSGHLLQRQSVAVEVSQPCVPDLQRQLLGAIGKGLFPGSARQAVRVWGMWCAVGSSHRQPGC